MIINSDVSHQETMEYVKYLEKKHNRKLSSINVMLDGDYVDLQYQFVPVPFERIRRITGYLVGDMGKWNDGKTAEEADRVKHTLNKMETLK